MSTDDYRLNPREADLILLGAGFSACVTGGQAPVMSNFFRRLNASRYPHLAKFLSDEFGDPHASNVEEVMLALEQISTCPPKLKPTLFPFCRDQSESIRRDLCAYCLACLSDLKFDRSGHWATHLLTDIGKSTTVITTNYDNLAERLLSNRPGSIHHGSNTDCHHCKMFRLLIHECGCHVTGQEPKPDWRGSIIKLHGSIAWSRCINRHCCNFECLTPEVHCRPYDLSPCTACGHKRTPVIVLPSMSKHLNEFPEIATMWNAAHEALLTAKNLLVFGFSFARSDQLFSQLFRNALASNPGISRITVIDRHPEDVIQRLTPSLPASRPISLMALLVNAEEKIPKWMMRRSDVAPTNSRI